MEIAVPAIIAIVVVAIAWKVLKGIIRTIGLFVILAGVAAFIYFSGGA